MPLEGKVITEPQNIGTSNTAQNIQHAARQICPKKITIFLL